MRWNSLSCGESFRSPYCCGYVRSSVLIYVLNAYYKRCSFVRDSFALFTSLFLRESPPFSPCTCHISPFFNTVKYCLFRALACRCPHALRLLCGAWHPDEVVGGTGSPVYIWPYSCGGTSQTSFPVSPSHGLPRTGICVLCNLCSGRGVC